MPIARNTGYSSVSIPKTDENTAKALAAGIIEALKGTTDELSADTLKIVEERLKEQLSPLRMMDLPRVAYVMPIRKAAAQKPAPIKAGEVALNGVPPRDAAMVMAIVCDNLKCEPSDLNFKSIKIR